MRGIKMSKIAVIGAEESIGREVLNFLADGNYKVSDIVALEPKALLGATVSYGEDERECEGCLRR